MSPHPRPVQFLEKSNSPAYHWRRDSVLFYLYCQQLHQILWWDKYPSRLNQVKHMTSRAGGSHSEFRGLSSGDPQNPSWEQCTDPPSLHNLLFPSSFLSLLLHLFILLAAFSAFSGRLGFTPQAVTNCHGVSSQGSAKEADSDPCCDILESTGLWHLQVTTAFRTST